jgi:hypothetical protein
MSLVTDLYPTPRYRVFTQVDPVAQVGRYDIVRYRDMLWAVWETRTTVEAAYPGQSFTWLKVPEADRDTLRAALELLK